MKKTNYIFALIAMLFFTAAFFSFGNPPAETSGIIMQAPIVGSEAPEIEMSSPSGKKMKLSSLRGKYVLLDFWASWCGPCRKENPNVVSAYKKYSRARIKNGKGFEIYSVSLDKAKDPWEKAIKADGLKWKYHVSDLKGWSSDAALLYTVRSIPYNFLIGPDGKILAANLRGMNLHTELDKYIERL